jgi:NAD(P)H-flavin reductase
MKKEIFESKLLYKKYLTEDLMILGFEADLDFKAGQFFHIIIDKENPDDEKIGFRPYSILNSPHDSKSRTVIESFIKVIPGGLGSEYVAGLDVNDPVFLRGPF